MSDERITSVEELYERLHDYIHWLAHEENRTNNLHFLLSPEDVAGELFCELVVIWQHYEDRDDLDADTLIRIVKASLDNRIGDLIYTWHVTYRKDDARNVTLDIRYLDSGSPVDPEDFSEEYLPRYDYYVRMADYTPDPDDLVESKQRVRRFMRELTAPERKIVDAILGMDERLARQAKLVGTRKAFVYKSGGTVTLKSSLVADALHIDRKECSRLWGRIRKKWRKYEAT